jgi:hypothetical protein
MIKRRGYINLDGLGTVILIGLGIAFGIGFILGAWIF